MLPNHEWRWLHSDSEAFLHWRFACMASLRERDGFVDVRIKRRRRPAVVGRALGIESGKRHVERWLEAHGWIVF